MPLAFRFLTARFALFRAFSPPYMHSSTCTLHPCEQSTFDALAVTPQMTGKVARWGAPLAPCISTGAHIQASCKIGSVQMLRLTPTFTAPITLAFVIHEACSTGGDTPPNRDNCVARKGRVQNSTRQKMIFASRALAGRCNPAGHLPGAPQVVWMHRGCSDNLFILCNTHICQISRRTSRSRAKGGVVHLWFAQHISPIHIHSLDSGRAARRS